MLGLLVLCAMTMIGYAFVDGRLPIWPSAPFDAAAWRHGRTSDNHVRLRMVDPLLESGRLEGLTRPQVLELLGPPDGGSYFRDWDFVYWLGPERGFISIDSEWLVLRLGSDGRVSEYRVVRD
jgi:hypothetical protein